MNSVEKESFFFSSAAIKCKTFKSETASSCSFEIFNFCPFICFMVELARRSRRRETTLQKNSRVFEMLSDSSKFLRFSHSFR